MQKLLLLSLIIMGSAFGKELFPEVRSSTQRKIFEKYINKGNSIANKSFNSGNAVRPSGYYSWFTGSSSRIYNWRNNPTNSSDKGIAQLLYTTYNLYCSLKGRGHNCLKGRLKTYVRSKQIFYSSRVRTRFGWRRVQRMAMYSVYASGYWHHTGSLRDMQRLYFRTLEKIGGYVANSHVIHLAFKRKNYVPIHLHVLTGKSGRENAHWLKKGYTDLGLSRANDIFYKSGILFKRGRINSIRSDDYFVKSQYDLISKYRKYGKFGEINVVITGPTEGSAGLAYAADYLPNYFLARSISNPMSSFSRRWIGDLFVHELIHTLGYSHTGTPVNTGNYITHMHGLAKAQTNKFLRKIKKYYPY